MVDTKPQPSVVDRILNRGAPRHEPEVEDADLRSAFEGDDVPKSRGRAGIMLDVRKADGQCHGMSYAYLTHIDFDPGDRLKLHFAGGKVVQIQGRGLKDLYQRLLDHRVRAVQEGTDSEDGLKPEDAAHIDRIELITRKEADHDDD